jgi:hypothetical protein
MVSDIRPCATLRAAASRNRRRALLCAPRRQETVAFAALLRAPRRQSVGLAQITRCAVTDFGDCCLGQFERSEFILADSNICF